MAHRAFYSFHYKPDNWRAAKVRQMGVIEGNASATDNEWETITSGGDAAIRKWIDGQIYGKSIAIVLIGAGTYGRKWINYEIEKAWKDKKGLLGIYIHNLLDRDLKASAKGRNPFDWFTVDGKSLSRFVKAYDPPFTSSQYVYDHIKKNLAGWIDEAINLRTRYAR